ncbi:MAG: hypothetical protein E3J83_01170 [Candidatus Atribacteria bacterium]|nr:MAG: hypothetical protein E3J83_01170 [Candidatus Atribacteria bacterium]
MPPNPREEKLINNLRSKISSLPGLKDGGKYLSEDLWVRHCIELKNNLLNKDPREFLKWDVMLKTMYHQTDEVEFNFLKSHPNWELFKKAIKREFPVFHSVPYFAYRSTNSNTVHHAYHIAQLLKYANININKLSTVFEFGGGYGNMCRLFFNLGFKGNYTIFDLPIFNELQRYYLSSLGLPLASDNLNNIKKTSNIILMSDTKNILDDFCNKGLFIGTWSISEVPVYFRKKIFKIIGNPDYFLLAYQNNFEEVDNVKYFKSFCAEKKNYLWHDFEIEHLKGNRYLIGEKIK